MIVYSAKRFGLTPLILGVASVSTLLSVGCVNSTSTGDNRSGNSSNTAINNAGQVAATAVTGNWQLFEIPGYASNQYRAIYRRFMLTIDNRGIHGAAANNYSAGARWGNGTVRLTTQLATTRKMVMGDTGQLEKIYLHRLANAGQWQINGQQLTLRSGNGDLIFQRIGN